MRFLTIATLLVATTQAIKIQGEPAGSGAPDKTRSGIATWDQAKLDLKKVGYMMEHSDKVWAAAKVSKNKPISTQPIPTPPGPVLPIHNKNKAGNGDTILSQKNREWQCTCTGAPGPTRTCVNEKKEACDPRTEAPFEQVFKRGGEGTP